jgi:hypothetical protein
MKKQTKHLRLHRETLGALERGQTLRAAGATAGMCTTAYCEEASWCACASETFCNEPTRWDHTCGGVCW